MTFQSRLKGAAAPIALSIALLAQPAFAQDDASTDTTPAAGATEVASADDNVIVVTGSRLAQAAVTAQPTQSLQGQTLTDLGYTTSARR